MQPALPGAPLGRRLRRRRAGVAGQAEDHLANPRTDPSRIRSSGRRQGYNLLLRIFSFSSFFRFTEIERPGVIYPPIMAQGMLKKLSLNNF